MQLAASFLLLYSITLSLAPAARLHSFDVQYRWTHWIGYAVWLACAVVGHNMLARYLPSRDPYIFPVGMLLTGWGLLSIWRLDAVNGPRQTLWLAVGLAVIIIGLRFPNLLNLIRRYKYLWLVSGLLLTGLTFLFGTYPGGYGPRLWLGCCGIYLQPSEPLKLLLIAYLAAYLADHLPVSTGLLSLLTPTLILIGAALVLLVAQQDLGTASLFILIYTTVVYIASQHKRILVISMLGLLVAGVTGYMLFDVVRVRVDAWINPWIDPAGRSYQIIQSLLAVASGSVFGSGPGLGSPGVVPVSHSDFIFASIAEESGLIGIIGLMGLFAIFIQRGFLAAMYAPNNYRRYLAAGITAYLAIQGIFIIGGNVRLLPLTGVTLPFVSYGGSSLVTAFVSMLILLLVSSHGDEEPAPLHPTPYLLVGGGLMLGLLALALVSGWWAVPRSEALLDRPENPRRVVNDRFVLRGALLDRNNSPINRTAGKPGEYQREYLYPQLSDTTGHNSPIYGQAGLESGLDDYLRGLRGNLSSLIALDNLLYRQPPPGLDIRLSIDLSMQKSADDMLGGHKGALVLLNANTGEVLAIASHPNYDPNKLESSWLDLAQDPNAPLFDRATQGRYLPGTALGPFLFAYAGSQLPAGFSAQDYTSNAGAWKCTTTPPPDATPGVLVANGCPAPLVKIGEQLGADGLKNLFASLGFYQTPQLPLQVAVPVTETIEQVNLASIGQDTLLVTPMQMALAAAALTGNGSRPSPLLATAVLTPNNGWVEFPAGEKPATILAGKTANAAREFSVKGEPYWQALGSARSDQEELTWYLGGTLSDWQGSPLAIALVLEENNPQLAAQIGQAVLKVGQ